MSEACLLVRVQGRVQGVCFRHYTREEAIRLGITGWVRNCSDGSVEVLICGSDEQLEAMLAWLNHGPELASVTQLDAKPAAAEPLPTAFEIRY